MFVTEHYQSSLRLFLLIVLKTVPLQTEVHSRLTRMTGSLAACLRLSPAPARRHGNDKGRRRRKRRRKIRICALSLATRRSLLLPLYLCLCLCLGMLSGPVRVIITKINLKKRFYLYLATCYMLISFNNRDTVGDISFTGKKPGYFQVQLKKSFTLTTQQPPRQ